ncbi:hypothetical protein MKZ38_009840 [Zalerion maritima]|uniref:Uncharacterized protein n=1 Tax=Zalerion maritima TaxID=339359 RepID=A0AAD5RYD6_9PEZI|nr:hypothetical protein MKZ38_009840 [Zalerion maritima]
MPLQPASSGPEPNNFQARGLLQFDTSRGFIKSSIHDILVEPETHTSQTDNKKQLFQETTFCLIRCLLDFNNIKYREALHGAVVWRRVRKYVLETSEKISRSGKQGIAHRIQTLHANAIEQHCPVFTSSFNNPTDLEKQLRIGEGKAWRTENPRVELNFNLPAPPRRRRLCEVSELKPFEVFSTLDLSCVANHIFSTATKNPTPTHARESGTGDFLPEAALEERRDDPERAGALPSIPPEAITRSDRGEIGDQLRYTRRSLRHAGVGSLEAPVSSSDRYGPESSTSVEGHTDDEISAEAAPDPTSRRAPAPPDSVASSEDSTSALITVDPRQNSPRRPEPHHSLALGRHLLVVDRIITYSKQREMNVRKRMASMQLTSERNRLYKASIVLQVKTI